MAATFGAAAIVKLLLATAQDAQALLHQRARSEQYRGATALHWAAESGQVEVSKLLLGKTKDLEATLLQKGSSCDIGVKGGTPLHLAAAKGHAEMVQILLDFAPNPGVLLVAADAEGSTPALLAEAAGRKDSLGTQQGKSFVVIHLNRNGCIFR